MVLCSLQVDSSSALSGTSVTEISFRNISGPNQQTYDRLKVALSLNLRRQLFIAVCDDLPLRDRLAVQLQAELAHFKTFAASRSPTASPGESRAVPRLVTLDLDLNDPNPIAQVAEWMNYLPHSRGGRQSLIPAFQVLGVERLTRQSAAIQSVFLSYLQNIEQELPLIESYLLIWMTQPWFRMLPEAVPEFWRCRTGVFEFTGDPTPLPATSPERIQLNPPNSSAPSSRELPDTPPSSNSSDQSPQASSTIELPANPWIPLAEDLNLWYEPDSDQLNLTHQGQGSDATQSPQIDRWAAAFSQLLEQELTDLDSTSASRQLTETEEKPFHLPLQSVATHPISEPLAEPAPAFDQDIEVNAKEIIGLAEAAIQEALEAGQTFPLLQHIELLQQQIERLQQGQESPVVVATAYRTLGNFYRDCIEQGDATAQNLTFAVQAYEQALQWLPEDAPEQAEVLNDLGSLYWMIAQIQTNAEEAVLCLQQTVQIYQLALKHLDHQQQTQTYAMVQNNLGAAYADLARYQDPVENLQRSIEAYQQVLHHRTAAADLLRYASTQNNLGTTYWNLAQHQQPELNLKQAISAYSAALHQYDAEQDPVNFAMIQNNLGTAYWNLAQYEQPQDYLTLALAAYQAALQYRRLDNAPAAFAATQNNLGTAYWHLANHTPQHHERAGYLQQAILAYEATLQAAAYLATHQPMSLNFDLASTQNNLGLAHYQLASDPHGHLDVAMQANHLEAAMQHHLLALQGWEHNAELQQTALNCILQVMRAFYTQLGLSGQNQALSQIPSHLLPEILPKL